MRRVNLEICRIEVTIWLHSQKIDVEDIVIACRWGIFEGGVESSWKINTCFLRSVNAEEKRTAKTCNLDIQSECRNGWYWFEWGNVRTEEDNTSTALKDRSAQNLD